MPAEPSKAYLVSHTHWDREWYRTFHEFRVDLVEVVGEVLDLLEAGGPFRHFLLDGQAVVLEDHLAARPEDRDRIRALVERGALAVGPWYVLPDEFLVSAEAHVRNLIHGEAVCRALGGAQRVGYMPDSFGHIAQMPQILRRAGIDSFVYTRGNGDELDRTGFEYLWRAPDGSEVLAVNQCGGYCNAGGLGFEELWHAHTDRAPKPELAVETVRGLFAAMAERSDADVRLLNNGCDHFPPQPRFGEILDALREAFPRTEFVHGGLAEYLEDLRGTGAAKEVYEGEMLGGKLHLVLSGVWSARMPLKQANDRAQELLAGVLEPALAYLHFAHGRPYPQGLLDDTWKLLLRTHPHDSICGCSTDEVHREMVPRFAGVIETGERILEREMNRLAPMFGREPENDRETVVAVLNPLPAARTEVVERLVILQPLSPPIEELALADEDGHAVPFEVVEQWESKRFWGVDYRAQLTAEEQLRAFANERKHFGHRVPGEGAILDRYAHIRFVAELPALGHRLFRLVSSERPGPPPERAVGVEGNALENERVRVTLHGNGTFDLLDKESGREFRRQNLLTDDGDCGDEYDFSPRGGTVTARTCAGTVRIIDAGRLSATLEAEFGLPLPAALLPDRSDRAEERVTCPVRVRVTLRGRTPLVEVETIFWNSVRDHRLRARFPTGIETGEIVSDGHFLMNRRPIERPSGAHWVQPAPSTWPQQEFSLVEDERGGLAILNRGLPEVEASTSPRGGAVLHLTLLRSVGWLSRDDFESRKFQNAGPTLHTPEAQCLGERRFRYAVLPHSGHHLAAGVKGASRRYRVPLLTHQGVLDKSAAGGGDFLSKETAATSITAVKRHRERDSLVVRLVNLTSEPVEERLALGLAVSAAWRTDLLEQRLDPLAVTGGHAVRLALGPHEIATVEIDLETPR